MTLNVKKLRVGTRGSKLALVQTNSVCDALRALHPDLDIEITVIKAAGDWKPEAGEIRLSALEGGKGQFVKDIEEYILNGHVDLGVHSLKDVPTFLPDGLVMNHFMPREDARDAFISHSAKTLADLPAGSVVGTSSVRRGSVILNQRPDLMVTTFRGNIDTRLEKLKAGQVDAIILAVAGLKRIGYEGVISSYLEPEVMLPAVGQGVIGLECRADDAGVQALLESINHAPTRLTTLAERALLAVMNGSCSTPIGSYACFTEGTTMRMRGLLASLDGEEMFHVDETAAVTTQAEAVALGTRAGHALRKMVPASVLLAIAS